MLTNNFSKTIDDKIFVCFLLLRTIYAHSKFRAEDIDLVSLDGVRFENRFELFELF